MADTSVKAWTNSKGGYPNCLKQSTLSQPSTLSPSQVLVRIHAAALNPVDIQVMNLPIWSLPFMDGEKGVGCDFSGTILRAGPETELKEGDEVYGMAIDIFGAGGTLAEVQTIDTKKSAIVKKPEGWSRVQAAALPLVWLTARTCIESIEPYMAGSKTVGVLGGSSATGMYVVHLAKQKGWNVVASCSGRNTDFVKSMGAADIIDYTKESVPDRMRAAKPDAIVDCVGGTECLSIAKRYVTIVGDKTSRLSIGGSMLYLFHPWMHVRWALGRLGLGVVYDCINLELRNDWLEESKKLPTEKIIIDSEFEFEKLKEAFERLNTGRARVL
ncbi:alcohol dehydrogenase [Rhizodiscina lignyota]|uniref:Alcohol dehydrogenase n=1 Tax=Rhizodiscina lignyota TaxID=1504668 RepID=A0A9P4IMN4_9PEZI|nr:alcohol dehydrogenase [Rhizodiscina lignyota]